MTRKRKSYQCGSVEEKPEKSGQWTLRYRELDHRTGKWTIKRERLGKFKNKTAARRAAEPIMARVNAHNNSDKPPEAAPLTFRQFVQSRWKAYSVKHQPSTVVTYDSMINAHLLPRFGDMLLREIKPLHISEFLESLHKKSPYTVKLLYAMLRVMFDLAQTYDLIEQSPVRPKLHRPRVPKVEKPTLSADEIRAVLLRLDDQERLFLLLIAVTGMRLGEAMGLRWVDFNEARREITVRHTLFKGKLKPPKTESSVRTLRLHEAVVSQLIDRKQKSGFGDAADFIFCRADGLPLCRSALEKHLQVAMIAAGINRGHRTHGFHIFRHTAGSMLYARSRDMKMVQEALGHSVMSTTSDVYVHLDGDTVAEATEMLAEEILGNLPANCAPTVTQESRMVS